MLFLTAGSCATPPPPEPETLPADAIVQYHVCATKIKAGAIDVDFTALRFFSTTLPGYNPFPSSGEIDQLHSLMATGATEAVSRKIDALFIDHAADIDFHETAAEFYAQSGNIKAAGFHAGIRERLIRSIMDSRTSFRIISFREADVVLQGLNLRVIGFTHEEKDGRHWEVYTVENPAGEGQSVSFDVTIIYTWLENRLAAP